MGGSLTRHDLGVQQDGSDTTTTMKHFILAGEHTACKTRSAGAAGLFSFEVEEASACSARLCGNIVSFGATCCSS